MSTLSTHVLDLVSGKPAAGMAISLWAGQDCLFRGVTNADGRCPELGQQMGEMRPGAYRLEFAVAEYFRAQGRPCPSRPSLIWCRLRLAWRQQGRMARVGITMCHFWSHRSGFRPIVAVET